MQSTMRHLYLDDLSRNDRAKGAVAGRGITMTAETSTCYNCVKKGHYTRNCMHKSTGAHGKPKNKEDSKMKSGSKDAAEQKLCCVHKTTSHDDAECYAQGASRPSENDNAHIASSAAVLSASSPPTNDDEKPSLNFDDFDKGLAFSGLVAGSDVRGFHPNVDRITMIVDSGASDHLVDDELIPRLQNIMKDYKKLQEPKIIVTAGNTEVLATATSTIWGHIIDQTGQRVPVRISAMTVPGLGRNLFLTVQQQHFNSAEPAP